MRALFLGVACALAAACAVPAPRAEPALAPGAEPALAPWSAIGRSVQGRPIEARTLGAGAARAYLIGGIHGDEHDGGRWIDELCESIAEALAAPGGTDGGGWTVRVVRDANPDGTAAETRANARGVDLNRNWPATSFRPAPSRGERPLSEPETAAVHADLERFGPDLVVVLHASRAGPFVNYDGPAEEVALRFAAAASAADPRWHVRAEIGYPTPGSFGSLFGVERGLPVLTIELEQGGDPEAAREALEAALLAILKAPAP